MFRERLEATLATILAIGMILTAVFFAFKGLNWLKLNVHVPENIQLIGAYILLGLLTCLLLTFVCVILYLIWRFIKWLIVEPYREYKQEMGEKNA
jgi:fructose-specific phosphotransferase system IIC component